MNDFEKIYDFTNLYKSHVAARRGKRDNREVIEFEMNLADQLARLSDEIANQQYRISGYYHFFVHDPKTRIIHALHYRDRIVQHCLCDEVLAPLLDKRLIYDNAACRKNKGTHFALNRVNEFLHKYYRQYGMEGYFLKYDIRKYFDHIDHNILKRKLEKIVEESQVLDLLFHMIDSYEVSPGKGLPLGNQTSQWFALYYMDGLDRLIKEQLHVKYYSRYMDDGILIAQSKEELRQCLEVMTEYVEKELLLSFNQKTQIFPIRNGADYLGFHIYVTESGKVIRKVRQSTKRKYKRKLSYMKRAYAEGKMTLEDIRPSLVSYHAHLSHGNTYYLRKKAMSGFVLVADNKRGQ